MYMWSSINATVHVTVGTVLYVLFMITNLSVNRHKTSKTMYSVLMKIATVEFSSNSKNAISAPLCTE